MSKKNQLQKLISVKRMYFLIPIWMLLLPDTEKVELRVFNAQILNSSASSMEKK